MKYEAALSAVTMGGPKKDVTVVVNIQETHLAGE